ncbi:MAG: bi-domain-containing oxidoreductase [candidate division Zixibacteria bacterium]|nr:bi-domain-containing oxidoreductase [candidate division Zixibacteria bacterium]
MKQVLQYNRAKSPTLVEVPTPQMKGKGLVVNNRASLISVGTERQMIELSQMSLLSKARKRPDLVRQVLDKVKTEGLATTYNKVMGRLNTPTPLGYSSAGVVTEVHSTVDRFAVGDRVACAGFGYACHAETVFVPGNLAVKIPENVTFEEASFVTLGAIALQGVRIADNKLGETVAVIGLGLLGQIVCMLLSASGCRVIGIDIDKSKLELAKKSGATESCMSDSRTAGKLLDLTAGKGADSVIITAASKTAGPIELAGEICREKGKVVVVGAVKMDIPRKPFYEKELEILMSRSYGPGRYDYAYEEGGHDYPFSYVRWTENRNMESFLNLIATGKIDIKSLITHRYDTTEAGAAYELVSGNSNETVLGVVLNYPVTYKGATTTKATIKKVSTSSAISSGKVGVGFVGAGGFASGVLLPIVKSIEKYERVAIMSGSGVSAANNAEMFGFKRAVSTFDEMLTDKSINTLFIANRHNQHAECVTKAIKHNKAVFVEKPLCMNQQELIEITKSYADNPVPLLVGFNRRFAPLVQKMKCLTAQLKYPVSMHYRINAGFIPENSWIQDEESGGGRIIGEVCHFVDLLSYLAGSAPIKVSADSLSMPDSRFRNDDNLQIMLRFANGSVGTINYVASGNKMMSKEYLEVIGGGIAMQMDDFKTLTIADSKGLTIDKKKSQDKGHKDMLKAWADSLTTQKNSPIPFDEIVTTTRTTFEIITALQKGTSQWMKG